MLVLIVGLLLFLGPHSVRIVAEDWRGRQIARLGEKRWKGIFALLSALGLGLTIWGFGLAGGQPAILWNPPRWTGHATALLTLPAFILLVAAYVPGNRIKAVVGHPMILGVGIWAFAHLLANGRARDLVLFGAFLVWAAVDYAAALRRQPPAGLAGQSGSAWRDAVTIVIGIAAWALFASYLHRLLIGVPALG